MLYGVIIFDFNVPHVYLIHMMKRHKKLKVTFVCFSKFQNWFFFIGSIERTHMIISYWLKYTMTLSKSDKILEYFEEETQKSLMSLL